MITDIIAQCLETAEKVISVATIEYAIDTYELQAESQPHKNVVGMCCVACEWPHRSDKFDKCLTILDVKHKYIVYWPTRCKCVAQHSNILAEENLQSKLQSQANFYGKSLPVE